ncbi:hypothetical protein EB118_25380 [bacterium]|nr:hypothetical protein [Actinomycetota bacterium]NDG33376.1 hypothetical protein [bacterium]
MSSSATSSNTGSTSASGPSASAVLTDTMTKLKSFGVRDWIYIVSFIISIALFSTAVGQASQFLGNNDDWNTLKPRITQISIIVTVGIILFWLGSVLYISTSDVLSIYFCLTIACLSLGLGFWAVIVASITK